MYLEWMQCRIYSVGETRERLKRWICVLQRSVKKSMLTSRDFCHENLYAMGWMDKWIQDIRAKEFERERVLLLVYVIMNWNSFPWTCGGSFSKVHWPYALDFLKDQDTKHIECLENVGCYVFCCTAWKTEAGWSIFKAEERVVESCACAEILAY